MLSCSWQYRSLDHDIGFGVFFSEKEKKSSRDVEEMVCTIISVDFDKAEYIWSAFHSARILF